MLRLAVLPKQKLCVLNKLPKFLNRIARCPSLLQTFATDSKFDPGYLPDLTPFFGLFQGQKIAQKAEMFE